MPLNAETLRPGTVFADPYGHILVLAKRIPQTGDAAGVLFCADLKAAVEGADLVIENVPEKLELKLQVLAEIDGLVSKN